MSTKTYDKHGKLLEESDTAVHPGGYGPRDADGRPLRGAGTATPDGEPAGAKSATSTSARKPTSTRKAAPRKPKPESATPSAESSAAAQADASASTTNHEETR